MTKVDYRREGLCGVMVPEVYESAAIMVERHGSRFVWQLDQKVESSCTRPKAGSTEQTENCV